uniref:Transmembrane protein 44 n=1 Tax=Athene cunicularia TaxID=194338 RepID=A0A663MYU1_ATHCN
MGEPVSHAGLPLCRRRRQQLRDGLLALTLPLSLGAGRSLLVPGPRLSRERLRGAQRRLLGAVFEVSCPLIVPPGLGGQQAEPGLWAAQCRGKPCTRRWLWATLCSATAGVLYAAAIVARDQQPGHILRALPWLLIALGSAALDMAVSFLSFSPGILGWDMEVDGAWAVGLAWAGEVPDAWALLAGEREEDDRRAEEEEVFFLSD